MFAARTFGSSPRRCGSLAQLALADSTCVVVAVVKEVRGGRGVVEEVNVEAGIQHSPRARLEADLQSVLTASGRNIHLLIALIGK